MNVSNLIILGPQGSGKTTQAELLAQTFGFALIAAGDVLRAVAELATPLGKRVHQAVNVEGRLVPSELISELVKEKIATIPNDRGLILDGYPRNLTQYESFKSFWSQTGRGNYQVVFIDIPFEEAVKRLTRRVTCDNCGAVYTEGTFEKCPKCGGRLVKRPDDTPQAIRKRLESFYSETIPMIRAIEADGKLLYVDGARPIDEVHRTIVTRLE